MAAILASVLVAMVMADGQQCSALCDSCLNSSAACTGIGCTDAGCCRGSGLLGGLLKPSDHCFDDFISPMSNFIFFEDPRTLTEARAIFFHHQLPDSIGTLGLPGGEVQ